MIVKRRRLLGLGGGLIAALSLRSLPVGAQDTIEIVMRGNSDGSHVWFDPIGIHLEPGRTVRWTNLDPGNSHTCTAYHPDNYDHPLRMPPGAKPWDSDYLLPNEQFSVTLTVPGVYDLFCVPHEQAGMVGRLVVGAPAAGQIPDAAADGLPPEAALKVFPSVEEIVRKGIVRHA
ncbi:MAG: plastocyanin/azurin family copper-binding protein [Hyphomicrobiales bacterium]